MIAQYFICLRSYHMKPINPDCIISEDKEFFLSDPSVITNKRHHYCYLYLPDSINDLPNDTFLKILSYWSDRLRDHWMDIYFSYYSLTPNKEEFYLKAEIERILYPGCSSNKVPTLLIDPPEIPTILARSDVKEVK